MLLCASPKLQYPGDGKLKIAPRHKHPHTRMQIKRAWNSKTSEQFTCRHVLGCSSPQPPTLPFSPPSPPLSPSSLLQFLPAGSRVARAGRARERAGCRGGHQRAGDAHGAGLPGAPRGRPKSPNVRSAARGETPRQNMCPILGDPG